MLHVFEPRYTLPVHTTISRSYMPALYAQEKAKVTKKIEGTTDGWSSRANNSYISLTVHYIDDQWSTCCHMLETAECTTDHTAANLATGLEEALEHWELPANNISVATTDNAKTITAAIKFFRLEAVRLLSAHLALGSTECDGCA